LIFHNIQMQKILNWVTISLVIKCQDAHIYTKLHLCNWYFDVIYIDFFNIEVRLNIKEWLTIFVHIYIKICMVQCKFQIHIGNLCSCNSIKNVIIQTCTLYIYIWCLINCFFHFLFWCLYFYFNKECYKIIIFWTNYW
jgi:hypothetical protein